MPLIKLCSSGTEEAKEKAAATLWHLALDEASRDFIGAQGGINPLSLVLAGGATMEAIGNANLALARLGQDNTANQTMIANALISMLEDLKSPPTAEVEVRAVHALYSLALANVTAPTSIMKNGAITPLVTVLTAGKSEESRTEAERLLQLLAESGESHHTAIAIALVNVLGTGSVQAQENATALLLTLSPSGDEHLAKRQSIAQAQPFKALIKELRTDSPRVKMLAAAVLAR